jgi:hypothetical protein
MSFFNVLFAAATAFFALAWKKILALARNIFAATDARDDTQAKGVQPNNGEDEDEGRRALITLISSVTAHCDKLCMISIYFVLYTMQCLLTMLSLSGSPLHGNLQT